MNAVFLHLQSFPLWYMYLFVCSFVVVVFFFSERESSSVKIIYFVHPELFPGYLQHTDTNVTMYETLTSHPFILCRALATLDGSAAQEEVSPGPRQAFLREDPEVLRGPVLHGPPGGRGRAVTAPPLCAAAP